MLPCIFEKTKNRKTNVFRFFSRGYKSRTRIYGFGDRCSTIELNPWIITFVSDLYIIYAFEGFVKKYARKITAGENGGAEIITQYEFLNKRLCRNCCIFVL